MTAKKLKTKSAEEDHQNEDNQKEVVKPSTSRQSRSDRAGIIFPVGRVHSSLKKGRYASRIGTGAPVYFAGVLEYLVREMVDLAAIAAKDGNKKRITPRHINLAIQSDVELKELLSDVTISMGGVLPHIHTALQPKSSKTNKKVEKGVKKKTTEE